MTLTNLVLVCGWIICIFIGLLAAIIIWMIIRGDIDLSQLISGDKKNPTAAMLAEIGEYLGIPWNYLYQPPPPADFLEQLNAIDPNVAALLRRRGNN